MSFSPSHHLHSHSSEMLTDEKLERAFREIEEASERRAREEEEEASSQPAPLDPAVIALPNMDVAAAKKRHRQSISVSRIGSYPDVPSELQSMASSATSPVPWAPPPLYRTGTQSTTSLASASSFESSAARHEEENHTTQKETIAGRRNTITKAVSSAFAKTLTRMRSRGALNEDAAGSDEPLVIGVGVAVHEATEEAQLELEGGDAMQPQESNVVDSSPSRRVSISIKAEVRATTRTEGRSRSGSINKLRGKLPSRISAPASVNAKQPAEDAPATSTPTNANASAGEALGRMETKSSSSSPSPNPGTNTNTNTNTNTVKQGQGRRLSYFAKALAQRLRRRSSREEDKKEKEKEKENLELGGRSAPPDLLKTPKAANATTAAAEVPLPPSPRKITFVDAGEEVPLPPSASAETETETEPAMVPLPSSPLETSFAIPTLRIGDAETEPEAKAKCDEQAEPGSEGEGEGEGGQCVAARQ